MVKHYNPSLVERFQRIFNFKSTDRFKDDISGPVAVIPVEPVSKIVRSGNTSSSGALTIFTTPSDKDFYLVGGNISLVKDVTCDAATGTFQITCTIDGVAQAIMVIGILTLTAQSEIVNLSLPYPIKVDRGTAITGSITFTAGACRRTGCIIGYTEETTNT